MRSPIRKLDEKVAHVVSAIAKKTGIDNRKRYFVSAGLFISYAASFLITNTWENIAPYNILRLSLGAPAGGISFKGMLGMVKETVVFGEESVDFTEYNFRRFNNFIRPYALIAGAGLVGKFVYDIFGYFSSGSLNPQSCFYLQQGAGLLALSASMYFSEEKLLLVEKAPAKATVKVPLESRINP